MGDMADLELERAEMYDLDMEKCLPYDTLQLIEIGFWRDKQGKLHKIATMPTSPLNNLVKMLDRKGFEIPLHLEIEMEYRTQNPSRESGVKVND